LAAGRPITVELPSPRTAAVAPASLADQLLQVRTLISRHFLAATALLCACAMVLVLVTGEAAPPMAAAFGLLAAGCWLARRTTGRTQASVIGALMLATIALITASAWFFGTGLTSPAAGFLGLLVCMAAAMASRRWGYGAAAAALAAVALLAWGEAGGLVGQGDAPLARRITSLVMLIGAGLAGGTLFVRLLRHYVVAATEREVRFASLLGIAVDAYWEMNADYHITRFARREPDGGFVTVETDWDRPPWEVPQLLYDEDLLDAHRADLEQREPFRDMPVRWTPAAGAQRHMLWSGQPRLDAQGRFLGYWGVARDVSAEVSARQALRSTETRYRELFARIPTPLVLHMGGRVVDANPAALDLFGFPSLRSMIGQDLAERYDPAHLPALRERVQQLEQLALGQGLPVAEFRVFALDGRRSVVRTTSVRVETEQGPATLTIYHDDTERLAAEEAVRRSEALLSHVVATSPDMIALADTASGRYAMVNAAFTRLTGWKADEVIGRSAEELGLWGDPGTHARLATLARRGEAQDLRLDLIGKGGEPLPMRVSAARFAMDGRDYLVLNGRDVSGAERSRLEREAILESASIGIALTRDQAFQLANPRFEQMFGWPRDGMTGCYDRVIWADGESYRNFHATWGPALARGEQIEVEQTMTRRDGSQFLCRMLVRAVDRSHPARGGTIWIAEDVTDRRAVDRALAQARDEAEAANRAKSAFLANTSHEIRTPLNGLLGLARLARQSDLDEGRRRQYLEQIGDSAEALTAIISDILDLSKIEAGKLHLEAVPFDLRALLATLQRAYTSQAEALGLRLHVELAGELPQHVIGDPLRVRQILSNYLSNAVKFTPRGDITLRALTSADGERLRFEVHDTGPGIETEVQERLFKPFTQADESTTRRFGGTGLGLSICRELAQLMNGEVGVHSQPGRGSCFWAELQLPATDDAGSDSGFGALDPSTQPLAGRRVLLVEDNPVNMMIAVALLEQWGVRVTQASDGRQAVAAVQAAAHDGRPFDAVLMDVQMPVMSGYEATRVLRASWSASELPVIALTAAALVSEREQALAAGMDDFVTKPVDAQRLHAALTAALRRRGG
jgi:PAS domain S-box-containing protein